MQNQFQLQGILSYISDVTKGTSKSGKDWQKLEIVIATEGEYSKDVHFTIFGEEKVKTFLELNKTGRKVNVFFNYWEQSESIYFEFIGSSLSRYILNLLGAV